jgi:ribonuclease HI
MPKWLRRKLRDNAVYVRVDDTGRPISGPDGRVDVLYKLAPGAKVYRASPGNLLPTNDPADATPIEADFDPSQPDASPSSGSSSGSPSRPRRPTGRTASAAIPSDAIIVYTDGACTGNPGPAGIGVVILDGKQRRELSEYLGQGTNNIAELTAIERALEELVGQPDRTVVIHADSAYAIGLLSQNWKAKANVELVARMRQLASRFKDLRFVKVAGHAGVSENERCDELARQAVYRGR